MNKTIGIYSTIVVIILLTAGLKSKMSEKVNEGDYFDMAKYCF